MQTTIEVFVEPSAIVVGLGDDMLALCHEFLPPGGLEVHRVANAQAACDHIAVLLPRLVVVSPAMRSADLDMIEDRAVAVGAIVLYLDPEHGYELLGAQLYLTVQDLRVKYGHGTAGAE